MKKSHEYEINFATNTITVTRKFLQEASQIGTDAFTKMRQLQELNMPIAVQEIHRKPKVAKWTFARMERYLLNVEDSEKWTADYTALKQSASHAEVWGWFKSNFIRVDRKGNRIAPKLTSDHKIMVLPKAENNVTPINKKATESSANVEPNAESPAVKGA